MTSAPVTLHASAVSWQGRGALIEGRAGAGKSALALALMARGARLLADDRTCVARRGENVVAWAPAAILGLIEARGVGLLRAEPGPPAPLTVIADLDLAEPGRLPPHRTRDILGIDVTLVLGAGHPYLADVLIQILKEGLVPAP
ncbi:HPr kinase/phosphorylase [Palleronia rufa]